MSAPEIREVQILRRQALWFREFARLGDEKERAELDALAERVERQARDAWEKAAEQALPTRPLQA